MRKKISNSRFVPIWLKPDGGLTPKEIRHRLKIRGVTITGFAAEIHAGRDAVSRTIRRKNNNRIIRRLLSLFLEVSEQELFGSDGPGASAVNKKSGSKAEHAVTLPNG